MLALNSAVVVDFTTMIPPFDLFRIENDRLSWQGTAESLNVARLHVKILMVGQPGDYVICSQHTGHKMVIKADGSIVGPNVTH
jgi:hypothetical protein